MASGPFGFPSTQWSRIVTRESRSRDELGELLDRYWRPIYTTIRARWRLSDDDARDCTQGFVVWIMEGELLDRADPARGRFRAFVRSALNNYMIDRARSDRAEKRGGGRTGVPLDDAPALVADASSRPEEVLDAEWRRELVSGALLDIREELRKGGQEIYFQVFEEYFQVSGRDEASGVDRRDSNLAETSSRDVGSRSVGGYRGVAVRHGLTPDDVSNYLRKVKKLYRAKLKARVVETVNNPEDLERELEWLFGKGEA